MLHIVIIPTEFMGNECTNMCKNPELKMKFDKEEEKLVEWRPEPLIPYCHF